MLSSMKHTKQLKTVRYRLTDTTLVRSYMHEYDAHSWSEIENWLTITLVNIDNSCEFAFLCLSSFSHAQRVLRYHLS